jgi:transposase InsO family protein
MSIEAAHVTGRHMAAQKTLVRVNKTCYFPGMKRIVAEFVLRCRSCQSKSNKMNPQQTGTLASVQAGFPFQQIYIDFVGPLAASSKGNKYILTVKDCFTRWIEAFPIVAATALETVDILVKEISCRYGVPEIIHSRGDQFTSNLFHSVAREYGIQVTTTPAYNPKSNPV